MARLFSDDLHEDFGTWPVAYIPYGGADYGEIRAVAAAVGNGDDGAYCKAWNAAGARMAAQAHDALARGHDLSARELFLRASVFHGASYHPIYGAPVDPRLLAGFRAQMAAFDRGLALGPHPVAPVRLAFGGGEMAVYVIPAQGFERQMRPLVILNGGYDSTLVDSYFASAVAASRRGYHSLVFDGPGQGAMLVEQGVPLRADWEAVIATVVDYAAGLPIVDPARIALSGWSLGGLLAPRAASGEARIAALVADPGTWSIADGFRKVIAQNFGLSPEAVADLGALDQDVLDRMDAFIRGNRQMNWKVVQRGFWVHGVGDLRAYLASAELFTMNGRAGLIRCPTLITQAEGDVLGGDAGRFMDELRCPRTLLRFSAAEGAGGHCEMGNRSALNRRVLDWLDERFAPGGR